MKRIPTETKMTYTELRAEKYYENNIMFVLHACFENPVSGKYCTFSLRLFLQKINLHNLTRTNAKSVSLKTYVNVENFTYKITTLSLCFLLNSLPRIQQTWKHSTVKNVTRTKVP